MSKPPSSGAFFGLAKRFRKLAGLLVEKPSNKVDEYVLEHILLYHGLVGSQEENQRQFRDVRADIIEAVNEQSSLNLAIALKLPPLWWDAKLATIFAEIAENKKSQAIATFLPEDRNGDMATNAQPLKHEDWRVRANAACVLAFLQAREATPHLVAALDDTTDSVKPAFCHIAYALGQLQGNTAKKTLAGYLFDDEAWTRVDAARALALFDKNEVAADLAKAMLSHHKLSDYMAVSIGRAIAPKYFLEQKEEVLKQGGLEMIISIIEASRQTFSTDIVAETNVHKCWSFLFNCLANNPTPQMLRAAYCLTQWLSTNRSQLSDQIIDEIVDSNRQPTSGPAAEANSSLLSAQILEMEKKISRDNYGAYLINQLKEHASDKEQSQLRHILFMVSALQVTEALPQLSQLLSPDSQIIDCVIDSLGVIGDNKTGLSLVAFAGDIVDLDERTEKDKVAQPVEEEKAQAAATYWCILKALSGLPSDDSAAFLLRASDDFAPDKRSQALSSLLTMHSRQPLSSALLPQLKAKVMEALDDPSTQMKTLALSGAADLNMIEALGKITKFTDATEVSLKRQAFAALEQLSQNGHKQDVESAVKAKLKSEFDKFKRQRLADFLQSL